MTRDRDELLRKLIEIQYERNDIAFERNRFRVRGDVVEIWPAYAENMAFRVEFFGDEIDRLCEINPLTGAATRDVQHVAIYPASHYVTTKEKMARAVEELERELDERVKWFEDNGKLVEAQRIAQRTRYDIEMMQEIGFCSGIENYSRVELDERVKWFEDNGKLVEAQRIAQRTRYDIEMMQEIGFCSGIENYSRVISGREPGSAPFTLIDYFPKDFLLIVDESHVTLPQVRAMYHGDYARKKSLIDNGFRLPSAFETLPQVRAMYHGDYARKKSLIDNGFRLPSAFDNRPLNFEEFNDRINQVIYVSATPGDYERERSGQIVEQVIRPTGLLDPIIEVRPVDGQIDDLLGEIHAVTARKERVLVTTLTKKMAEDLTDYLENAGVRVRYLHHDVKTIERMELVTARKERVLVTTLTKKMAEDLTDYLENAGVRVRYLHHDVKTIERMELIRDLRLGLYDVLVGINLLREGLDLPEVSLVAILDADKEGFLRSETSLIQTIGRAARNAEGRVVMYADTITNSMRRAIDETARRREKQMAFNEAHGIVPKTIQKNVHEIIEISSESKTPGKKRMSKTPQRKADGV